MAEEEGKGTLLGDAAALLAATRARNAPVLAAVPAPLLRDRIADMLAGALLKFVEWLGQGRLGPATEEAAAVLRSRQCQGFAGAAAGSAGCGS